MNNLRKRINKFYKYYSIDNIKLTRADMLNADVLMTAYENMWLHMDEDGPDLTDDECAWLTALYGDLGDYISGPEDAVYRWWSADTGEVARNLWNVIVIA